MLNQVTLVGRLTKDVELRKKGNKIIGDLKLAVLRPFKNEEGIYETDFIPCTLYSEIAKNTSEYCKKGDIIGIKGRLQTFKDGEKTELFITAEKVTFLQSANKEENKDE